MDHPPEKRGEHRQDEQGVRKRNSVAGTHGARLSVSRIAIKIPNPSIVSFPGFPTPTFPAALPLLHCTPRELKLDSSCWFFHTPPPVGPTSLPGFKFYSPRDLVARTIEPCAVGVLAARPPLKPAAARLRASTPAACSTECLWGRGGKSTREGLPGSAKTASVRCRTHSCTTCSRSCRRRRPCGHACSPSAGATSGSPPGLRVGSHDKYELTSVGDLRKFVDSLLLLHGGSPFDTFELRFGDFSSQDDVHRVNLWFRHAVMCKVRVLKFHVHQKHYVDPWLELDDLPLVSQCLTRLELHHARCHAIFLNFSSCPVLDHLEFEYCHVSSAMKILSESLKSLSITYSIFGYLWDNTPILESMPALAEAFVRITEQCDDFCNKLWNANQDCDCESCDSSGNIGDCDSNYVLLKGLSEAKNLALISKPQMFIFKRDWRWCPTFSKLKTLLLNDYWCVPDDLHALACIIEHSSVLERLTLQLFSEGPKHKVEMKGSLSPVERSAAISKYLQLVAVKFDVIDERVLKVLKFLCTFNILFDWRCKQIWAVEVSTLSGKVAIFGWVIGMLCQFCTSCDANV